MRTITQLYLLGAGILALGLASAATRGEEVTIVYPSEFEHVEAPDGGRGGFLPNGGRNQWIVPNEAFSLLPETHHRLIGTRGRPDGILGRADTVTWSNLKLYISTTNADSLSDSFSENVGQDETLVYDGPITISTMNTGPVGGPKDFDASVRFQQPFVYDPSSGGNLLFTSTIEGPWRWLSYDEELLPGDAPINQIWALDAQAELATERGASRVPTQYVFVPEPSSAVLTVAGLVGLLGYVWRRNRA